MLYPSVIDLIKARDGQAARVLARRALEQVDEAWSARHPPPAPFVAPQTAATRPGAKAAPREKQREKQR
ncbi:MAG: hypothetical protein ACLP1X_33495 [Polyangiaceae bacterium]